MKVWPGVARAVTRILLPTSTVCASLIGEPLEGDLVGRVHVVRRAGAPGQCQPAGHVVVVDVGLEDVGEPDVVFLEQVQHPVDVALRVDHERDLAVVDEVAAVAQGGRLDRDDGEVVAAHRSPPSTGRPERAQAVVPPVTDQASKPKTRSRSVMARERFPVAQMT